MSRKQELKNYLMQVEEAELRQLLCDFFDTFVGHAYLLHGTAEHGIDIAVKIPEHRDHVGKVQYIVIQVKCGNLGSAKWRNDVLGQLLEASYYPIRHPEFTGENSRRVLLILTGNLEQEVRQSIVEYNARHYQKIEVFELNDLVDLFYEQGYYGFFGPVEEELLDVDTADIKEYGTE